MNLPFDRHDWVVDRCGKEVKYTIDYYSTGARICINRKRIIGLRYLTIIFSGFAELPDGSQIYSVDARYFHRRKKKKDVVVHICSFFKYFLLFFFFLSFFPFFLSSDLLEFQEHLIALVWRFPRF